MSRANCEIVCVGVKGMILKGWPTVGTRVS